MKELDARDWDQRDLYSIKRFCGLLLGPEIALVCFYNTAGISFETTIAGMFIGLLADIPIMLLIEVT